MTPTIADPNGNPIFTSQVKEKTAWYDEVPNELSHGTDGLVAQIRKKGNVIAYGGETTKLDLQKIMDLWDARGIICRPSDFD